MKLSHTQKLFFDKYDHKVIMNVAHYHRHGADSEYPHPVVVEYLINELQPTQGIRVRHSSVYSSKKPSEHTIYFADKRVLDLLKSRFGEHIKEVMQPVNNEHTEALSKDKVIVREKLFHGKYRYCVRTSRKYVPGSYSSTSKHMEDMVKWCKETFAHLEERVDYYIYDGWTKSFFFASPSEVLLMKLTWGEDIDRTEQIKLLSELPPAE